MNTAAITLEPRPVAAASVALPVTAVAALPARSAVATRWSDYLELTKPKIAVLVLLTVGAGAYVAADGNVPGWTLLHAVLGTAMVAASASALNQWLERSTDQRMLRTANRPLPAGRLSPREVLGLGVVLFLVGTAWLALAVNPLTALLGVVTWLLYVAIYTPLKSRTTLNTAVGAVPGALPVLMGWAAVGGEASLRPWILFLIVFLWQFPHFMAIAWIYRHQYAAAGLKMLPSVDRTGRLAPLAAVLHALALIPVSLAPAVTADAWAGLPYFAGALVLGLCYLASSVMFLWRPEEATARGLLRASLVYLPLLFVFLMLDLTPLR